MSNLNPSEHLDALFDITHVPQSQTTSAKEIVQALKAKISPKVSRRYIIQLKITRHLASLEKLDCADELSRLDYQSEREHVEILLKELLNINEFILLTISASEFAAFSSDRIQNELDTSHQYVTEIEHALNEYKLKFPTSSTPDSTPGTATPNLHNSALG